MRSTPINHNFPAGRNDAAARIRSNNTTLIVHGIEGGTVKHVSNHAPAEGDLTAVMLQWTKLAQKLKSNDADETWKHILIDILRGGHVEEKLQHFRFANLVRFVEIYDRGDYSSLVIPGVRGRALLVSNYGYAGLGPASAKSGELRVPLNFSPISSDRNSAPSVFITIDWQEAIFIK